MYKVYLSPSTEENVFGVGDFGSKSYRMNQIVEEVEKELLMLKRYIVYRGETKDNDVDIYIKIESSNDVPQGVQCYPSLNSMRANGVAKEIYKELQKIYYDKNVDNGVIYDNNKMQMIDVNLPAVIIEVGCHKNLNDVNWIITNIEEIGKKIAMGIDKGMNLKLC